MGVRLIRRQGPEMDITKEIQKISEVASVPVKDVQSAIEKLKAEGHDDEAALAIFKSGNQVKNRLSGRIVDGAVLVPFRVRGPRETKTGKTVGDISAFIRDNGKWDARELTLWEEDVGKYLKKFAVGKPVKVKVKVRDDGRMTLLSEPEPSTEAVTVQQLVDKVGTIDLNELAKYAGMTAFVKGRVGRVFETPYGGGVEISDVGTLAPVTIYLDSTEGLTPGKPVTAVGFVKNKDGKTYVNGSLI